MTTVSIDVFSVFPVSPLALSQMLKSAQATTGGGSKATMQTANGTGGVIVIGGTGMQFDGTGHLVSGVVTSMIIYSGDTVSTPITAKITGFSFNAASGFATPTPAPLYDGVNIDYDATTAIGSGAIFFAAGLAPTRCSGRTEATAFSASAGATICKVGVAGIHLLAARATTSWMAGRIGTSCTVALETTRSMAGSVLTGLALTRARSLRSER